MLFLRTIPTRVSDRNRLSRSVRPMLEGCESRQLMSGVQALAGPTSLCKMAPAEVALCKMAPATFCKMAPAALCKMAPAAVSVAFSVGNANDNAVADLASTMIKHGI